MFAFAIAYFDDAGKKEIEDIASLPISRHLFHAGSFLEFQDIVETILSYPDTCAPIVLT